MIEGPLIWEALEYDHVEKSNDWYWAVGIIAGSIALISIILGNIIFAIVVVVSTFALIVASKRHPRLVEFTLSKAGLYIDNELRPFGTLRSFWVDDNSHLDQPSKLFFKPRSMTAQLIIIPIEEIDPIDVRDFLLHHLLEEKHEEPLLQMIMERLGF